MKMYHYSQTYLVELFLALKIIDDTEVSKPRDDFWQIRSVGACQ